MSIGPKLSPIFKELHDALWDDDYSNPTYQKDFQDEDLKYVTKIFASVVFDRMWKHRDQSRDLNFHAALAEHFGTSLRELVRQATTIDLPDLYREE